MQGELVVGVESVAVANCESRFVIQTILVLAMHIIHLIANVAVDKHYVITQHRLFPFVTYGQRSRLFSILRGMHL